MKLNDTFTMTTGGYDLTRTGFLVRSTLYNWDTNEKIPTGDMQDQRFQHLCQSDGQVFTVFPWQKCFFYLSPYDEK